MQHDAGGGQNTRSRKKQPSTRRRKTQQTRLRKPVGKGSVEEGDDVSKAGGGSESVQGEEVDGERRSQVMQLFRRPAARAVSPYTPRNEAADIKLQEMIYHYTTIVSVHTVTPVGPRREWFPTAAVDEALFHAVISHTVAHNAYLRKLPLQNDFDYFWHMGEALRLVNLRIREGLDKAANDPTICAVCCLTQQQAFAASVNNTKVHLGGLLQLIRAAGGISSPKLSSKTRRYVLLSDLASSITLNKRFHLAPTLVLLSPNPATYFPPSAITHSIARELGTRLLNFTGHNSLSEQAALVFWGLRSLSELLETIHAGRASPDAERAEDLQFTDRVEVLERAAHPLWYRDTISLNSRSSTASSGPTSVPTTPATPAANSPIAPSPEASTQIATNAPHAIFRLLGLATLIYIYTTLRELPRELKMLGVISTRISDTLSQMSESAVNVLLATFQDMMLWILFLAGDVAGPREKIGFARLVAKVLMIKGVEEQEGVLRASWKFLWPDRGGVVGVVAGQVRQRALLSKMELPFRHISDRGGVAEQ